MSVDLVNNKKHSITLSSIAWLKALELASEYGWRPKGTIMPNDPSWAKKNKWDTYFSNDAQVVTEADALEISKALRRAIQDLPKVEELPDLPERVDSIGKYSGNGLIQALFEWSKMIGEGVDSQILLKPLQYFYNNKKFLLLKLVYFFREGECNIF